LYQRIDKLLILDTFLFAFLLENIFVELSLPRYNILILDATLFTPSYGVRELAPALGKRRQATALHILWNMGACSRFRKAAASHRTPYPVEHGSLLLL
jgi:hypothetical protein